MKTQISLSSIQKTIVCALVAGASFAWCSAVNAQMIFSEDFEGGTGALLDGTTEDTSGAMWAANNFATDNGILDVGPTNFEGAATLEVSLEVDTVYTLSLDVTTNAAEWLGIGFTENGSNGGPNMRADRFAQSGGRAWFLLRPSDPLVMQVEIFGGGIPDGVTDNTGGTENVIPDINTNFSGPLMTRTMTVILDTASTGFTADFLIDGVSQSSGFQPLFEDEDGLIPLTDVSFLDNVGFTWEGQSPGGVAGAITVDNFEFSADGAVLVGDVNCDGFIDLLDVEPFVALLTAGGSTDPKADVNGDGVVDLLDVSPFVALLTGG